MRETFIGKFQIPAPAQSCLDVFFTGEDMDFAENMHKEIFSAEDVGALGYADPQNFLRGKYRRGIVSIADAQKSLWRLNDFYGFLDIFCITEREKYTALPEEIRKALDDWYFDAFYNGLDPDRSRRPTPDEILTVEETCALIDEREDPVYLNDCDCRSLTGECGLPRRTCLSYRNGINSFVDRGLSEQIDKERAKEVVRAADRAGLMHTVNPGGICNCCGDCCYLFRSQEKRQSRGFWPKTAHAAFVREADCVGCGRCAKRCHFGAISVSSRKAAVTTQLCVGCGICAAVCPTGALEIIDREAAITA